MGRNQSSLPPPGRAVAAGVLALAGAGACELVSVVAVDVDRVEVVPSSAAVQVGGSTRLLAHTYGEGGQLLSGRTVDWTSLQAGVAAVDEEGLVRGLSSGTATIVASSEGKVATAIVTVGPAPTIRLAPPSVELVVRRSDPPLSASTVSVTNTGGGSLADLAVAVRYGPGQREGWLQASLDATTAPTSLFLVASQQGLPVGVHDATVEVSSPWARQSPVAMRVRLRIVPGGPVP